MALSFLDSFDHYATADITKKWTAFPPQDYPTGNDVSGISAVGRHSSNGLRLGVNANSYGNDVTRYLFRSFPAVASTTLIFGTAFKSLGGFNLITQGSDPNRTGPGGLPAPVLLLAKRATSNQLWIKVNNNGTLTPVRPGSTPEFLGVTSLALQQGVFTYVEVKMVLDTGTSGSVSIRFNGVEVLNVSGINTQGAPFSGWDEIRLGPFQAYPGANSWDYDDVYVCDGSGAAPWNTFLGDCRVDVRKPTGAGTTSAWTPSTGANWQNVDDATPNADTDYNSTPTVGATDTYAMEDVAVAGATIYGVQTVISHKKADAGPCSLAPVIRLSGGADVPGTNFNPSTDYTYALAQYPSAPGSSGWTEAQFNGAEFGVKRTV